MCRSLAFWNLKLNDCTIAHNRFHNFEYGDIGLRVWKCYGIGKGKYIRYDVIYIKRQGQTYSTKIDKIQKSDIKTPLRRIMRKKASQRNTPLSFEKARIENTNTWLVTLFPERTNENGTPLILTAGKPSIKGWFSTLFGGIGIENFSACPWLTQPDLTKQLKRFFKNRNRRSC